MVKILADSTCDLSVELLKKYDIDIIPLNVSMDETEVKDGPDTDIDAIFKWCDENNTTPHTSAPSFEAAMDVMKPFLDEGKELVIFTISSEMSTSSNVMHIAAEELDAEDKVTVIDSRNLSTGIGLLVVEAAIMAKEGKTAGEIEEKILELIPKVRASFVVDTLTYLYRGGRCNAVAALFGSALKLHPEIVVKDGKMDASKKYRGKMSKVILDYANDLTDSMKKAVPSRAFVTHTPCDRETVDSVVEFVKSLNIFDEVLETQAGAVISSHCGPGTLGVLFIDSEE